MVSYIFGGSTNLTPEDIKRQRMIAEALAESRTPQNVGEGVGAVMRGIAGALVNARANAAEKAGRQSAMDAFSPILAALSDTSTPDGTKATPDFTADTSSKSTPQDVVDAAPAKLIDGTMENARKEDRSSVPGFSSDVRGFQKVLNAGKGWTEIVGPDGKTIRREGARNWRNNNPGNIEYGDFAKKLGAIGTDGRFAVFPTYEMGRKAKEALLFESPNYKDRSIASAITRYAPPVENDTNAYISSVANAIGVDAGTPLSALTPQQRVAMLDAMQKVEGFRPGREIPSGGRPQPVEVASLDGNMPIPATQTTAERVPVVPVPDGFEQPDPLQAKDTDPVEAAQATTTTTPKRRSNEPSDEIVIKALMNPWLDDSQRAVAEMYYKQRISEREFQRKLEAERNDPKYKMELEKGQLEIDKLKNPPKARNLTDDEEKALGLDTTGVYQEKPDGSLTTVREPAKAIDAVNAEKAKLELDNLRDPKQATELTADEKKALGLPADGVYQRKKDGSIVTVREPEKATADWSKLDDGRLFNQRTGEIKNVQGQTVGFRFPGNSPQAAALNGLIENGTLTEKQAMDIAAGKQLTGPNGEIIFATPQALIGGKPQQQSQNDGIDIFAGQKPQVDPAAIPVEKPAEKPVEAVPVMEQQNSGMVPLTAPKVTVDERKAAGFADRMSQSGAIIDNLETFAADKNTVYDQAKSDYIPLVGNFFTSDDFKSLDQAKRDFINAQLRRESGAVISPEEFDNANRQYFPQPGDTPDVIEQKRRNRETVIKSMMRDAGPTYKAPELQFKRKKKEAEEDIGAPPDGVTPEQWKYMTPEERKLWQN